jgi:hypothetical protein
MASLLYGFALVVLVMLVWPTAAAARRLLRRWRVTEPRPEQVAEVLSYLRRRRFWYPWLLLALGLFSQAPDFELLLASVLAALLIAELLALRPTRTRLRTATLVPRAPLDLVPRLPASDDPEVYAVLRIRSARVAIALGIALQGLLLAASVHVIGEYHVDLLTGVVPDWVSGLGVWINWLPVVAFFTCLSVWRSLVTPSTTRPLVTAR